MAGKNEATEWRAEGDQATGRVRIIGEIDFTNSMAVRDWLNAFADQCGVDVVLDLGDLLYIDSSGLAALIEVRKHLSAKAKAIRIEAVSPQVQKLFELTQIGSLFGL